MNPYCFEVKNAKKHWLSYLLHETFYTKIVKIRFSVNIISVCSPHKDFLKRYLQNLIYFYVFFFKEI